MVPVYSVDSLWKEILVFFTLHFEQPIQLELLAMQSFESAKEKGSVKLQKPIKQKNQGKVPFNWYSRDKPTKTVWNSRQVII